MSQPWMPLYIGDYLGDTRRLTTLDHGAYMLLIMDYWRNGGLPNDDEQLARIAGLSDESWKCVRICVAPLFYDGWRHKRIDKELKKASEKSRKARESAGNRWKHKVKLEDANAMLPQHSERNANAMLPQPHPYKEKINKKEPGVQEILTTCLSSETAAELIDHRKAKKCPLTVGAAKRLAEAFIDFGDPEKAASAMILNGWQGFNPEWVRKAPVQMNGHALPNGKAKAPTGIYLKWDRNPEQWKAWECWYRKLHDKSHPTDKRGGWYFPTEWPPNEA